MKKLLSFVASVRTMAFLMGSMLLLPMLLACDPDPVAPQPHDLPMSDAYVTDSVCYESNGMTAYNFVYPSTDPFGQPIMLSGTITMGPEVHRGQPARGMMLYNHFTVYRADQCPSRGDLGVQQGVIGSGLITVSADYYGFGVTEHHHQAYCISAVNAQASIDALLAARRLLADMGFVWDDVLFNTGYSQGGQTSMGVVRLVAQRYPDIDITCTFAGAGSYDIPETYSDFLRSEVAGMPSTVISVLLAYDEFFRLGVPHDEVFLEPVLSHLDEWIFSKRYTREEIDERVGSLVVADYVTPTMLDIDSPLSQRFLEAMRTDNICQGWTPRGNERILLFHNETDITVPVENTLNMYHFLIDNGVTDVTLDVADYGSSAAMPAHETGAIFFLLTTIRTISDILGIEPWVPLA